MPRASSYAASRTGTKPLQPMPLPKLPAGAKHLDEMLLALAKRRKRDQSTLPGVPFH